MKVYVAGSFAHKKEIMALVDFLRLNLPDFESTSSWLVAVDSPTPLNHFDHQFFIDEDIDDIDRADILLLVNTHDLSTTSPGRWTEFGIALASGKLVVVYGSAQESMFVHDQSVVWLPTDSRTELVMSLNAINATFQSLKLARDIYGSRANQRRVERTLGDGPSQHPHEDRNQDPRQGLLFGKGSALSDLDSAFNRRTAGTGGYKTEPGE